MTGPFHKQIRSALANPGLHVALDGNAERRRLARQQGYASLTEDLQVLRRRAHRVRAETIAHLDRYLDQFISKAEANGLTVHHAADAAQAVQIVLEIARQTNARLIAKAKTMVGEEIGLNHALEQAGLQVIETDLGEYIVQLRGERPAHILTPAVHLRRSDVAQTFHEKLGIPYTEDIPSLVAAARQTLRQTFLEAQIGVSGVNFGVAETGSLCLVTNEGNGRMVTTLPPVHIALMGIERLVPSLDDLALMLALLPRSGTGQKLTVYTSLIHSPRRPEDPEGPHQRHLILVDNGRRTLQRSPLAESLYCIRCGACLNACPVFREIGGHGYVGASGEGTPYPGPIGSVISPGLFGQSEFGGLARASSLCGACKEACPVDIDLPRLLLRVRAGGASLPVRETSPEKPVQAPAFLVWALRIFAWMAASPSRFTFAQRLAGITSRIFSPSSAWLRLPAFSGWGLSRDFPRPAARSFRSRWAGRAQRPGPAGGEATPLGQEEKKDRELESSGNPGASGTGLALEQQPAARIMETPGSQSQSLVERFGAELAALGVGFTRTTQSEASSCVLKLLREQGITAIQAWEEAYLPPGILADLQAAGISIQTSADPSIRAGLTGATAGIADTGSLVIPGGPGCPQTASLLPEIHIAILRLNDIYADLPQILKLREVQEAASISLITGPSRTADIEMTLSIGVHGPRQVQVICIQDPG